MDAFKWIINRFSHAVDIEFGGGGEPFLHSHIFEMIDYAQEHGILSMIPTNGTFLHDVLDRVVRFPLLLLNISLNACDSGEFFQLLGGSKKTYNTLLEDISQLVKMRKRYNKGLKIAISYVCTKANYRNIPKMVELAEDLGVDEIDFRNLISFDIPGFSKEQCLYVDDAEVIDVINSVPSPKSNLKVIMPRLYKREYLRRRCYVPFRIVTMDAEGNVSPCPSIPPRRDYGNVFADDDVWNNSAFRMRRGIFTNQSLLLPDFCKTCPGLVTKWRPAYISRKRAVR